MHPYDIRRAQSRGALTTDWLDARFSFSFGDYRNPQRVTFGSLRALNEDRIQPHSGFGMHPHRDMEIFLMPLSGAVAHADSLGNEAVLHPGDVLHMSAGRGIEHSQMNGADGELDHHLQIWLMPHEPGGEPTVAWRRFDKAERAGGWQLIASADGSHGSLRMNQDARIWRGSAAPGQALEFAARPDTLIYLHVIDGPVAFESGDQHEQLASGDALAWQQPQPFNASALEQAPLEVLLIEMLAS